MSRLARAAFVVLIPTLASSAVWYQPIAPSTTESPQSPRIVASNANYSISFVPLITLLSGILPRIINRIRTPTTNARDLVIADTTTPKVPTEFNGANPCIDSILMRRAYPGNPCFFYQCELYEPSSAICRLQVLEDPDSPSEIDYETVERKSTLLRITDCLAIRLYRCKAGHKYDKIQKNCVERWDPYGDDRTCPPN